MPDLGTSGHSTVAIRIPNHPMTSKSSESGLWSLHLVQIFLVTPPTTAAHVQEQLGDKIDAILDGGPLVLG